MSDEAREEMNARRDAEWEASRERRDKDRAREAAASENEQDFKGLVLLKNTLRASNNDFGSTITGIIVNRRRKKIGYVMVSFSLYDAKGRHCGAAIDNTLGLEPGASWKFSASGDSQWSTYKVNEVEGH